MMFLLGNYIGSLQALAERYGSQRDALSVTLLCGAAVQEFSALLPTENPELSRLRLLGEEAASLLSPLEMRVVRFHDEAR
jgi:hypothetical protein